MTRKKLSRLHYFFLSILGLLSMLFIWAVLSYGNIVERFFLPTPTDVFFTILDLLKSGVLLRDIGISFLRIFLSMVLAFAIAFPCGIALGTSRLFEAIAEPVIAFIRYIPPSAFIPLVIIWFGIGEVEKIIILFLGIAPYLTLLIADMVANTPAELSDVALTLGSSKYQIIKRVVIPSAMPGIWDALRIMSGAAWTYVIIAEIVGASSGLGHLMIESQRFLRTDTIYASIIMIGLLGLITDYFFKLTYQLFFPWTEKSHA
jgi:NitT/TauT family transport system permease protein